MLANIFKGRTPNHYSEWVDRQTEGEIKKAYKALLFYIQRAVLINPNMVLISPYFSKILDYSVFPFYWTEKEEEKLLDYYCKKHNSVTFEKVDLPLGYYYYILDLSKSGNDTKMPWEE